MDLALQVLREAIDAREAPKVTTSIRLALHALLPHCPEKWPLIGFWDGMHGSNEIGRHQTMNAMWSASSASVASSRYFGCQ